MKKWCLSLSVRLWVRWGCVSVVQQVLTQDRARWFLGLGFVQGQSRSWARLGHAGRGAVSGITALEHPASVSFGSQSPAAAAWEELGQTSHGAGGGDRALGAPTARGLCGDTEPGVSSALHLPFPLWVCLAASTAGKACGDFGNNREFVKVAEDLGCLGVM